MPIFTSIKSIDEVTFYSINRVKTAINKIYKTSIQLLISLNGMKLIFLG